MIVHGQKCIKKLTDSQTSTMIKVHPIITTTIIILFSLSILYNGDWVHINFASLLQQTARSAPDREKEINMLVREVNFNADPYLQAFGITVSNQMADVQGRILPVPKLQYGGRVCGWFLFGV